MVVWLENLRLEIKLATLAQGLYKPGRKIFRGWGVFPLSRAGLNGGELFIPDPLRREEGQAPLCFGHSVKITHIGAD